MATTLVPTDYGSQVSTTHSYLRFEPHADGHEEVVMNAHSTYYLPLAVYTTYPYFIHLPGGHEEVAMDDETLLTY